MEDHLPLERLSTFICCIQCSEALQTGSQPAKEKPDFSTGLCVLAALLSAGLPVLDLNYQQATGGFWDAAHHLY